MKLHLSMRVVDLESAVAFYSGLFGQAPCVRRDGYAKWDVADPAVNFVVQDSGGEGLDHLGIEVGKAEELAAVAERMRTTDRPYLDVAPTTCCYARSDKAWVKGPAGERWETFLTHGHDAAEFGTDRAHLLDAPEAGAATRGGCCAPTQTAGGACC